MTDVIFSSKKEKPSSGKLFNSLPDETQARLKEMLHSRKFAAGEVVYGQGEPAQAIYIVNRGRVKVVRVTTEGYESILCVRGPGDIFCPVPILDKGDQIGSAVALTDGELFWAEAEAFNRLSQDSPELLAYVQGDCLNEVRRLLNRMEAFAFKSIQDRLVFTLIYELERQSAGGEGGHELRLKQQELAGLVGASRESISRNLSALEDRGILSIHRGRLVIHDLEKLRALIGER